MRYQPKLKTTQKHCGVCLFIRGHINYEELQELRNEKFQRGDNIVGGKFYRNVERDVENCTCCMCVEERMKVEQA